MTDGASYERRGAQARSNRVFGLFFTALFGAIGLLPILSGAGVRAWALVLAGAFMGPALFRPSLLGSLNRLWTAFGLLLGRFVNPVVMFAVFCTTMIPIGLLLRLLGKDLLRLRADRQSDSYWIERSPPGPEPKSMEEQF